MNVLVTHRVGFQNSVCFQYVLWVNFLGGGWGGCWFGVWFILGVFFLGGDGTGVDVFVNGKESILLDQTKIPVSNIQLCSLVTTFFFPEN